MEYIDIYDKDKKYLSKCVARGTKLKEGEYYLISETGIISNGKILLTRRATTKKTDPNKWDIIGGHVQTGETSKTSAAREISEEIGINVNEQELIHINTAQNNKLFSDFYLVFKNVTINQISLQKEEVSEVKFVGISELIYMLENNYFSKHVTQRLKANIRILKRVIC